MEQSSLEQGRGSGELVCVWRTGADGRPEACWERAPEHVELVLADYEDAFLRAG